MNTLMVPFADHVAPILADIDALLSPHASRGDINIQDAQAIFRILMNFCVTPL
jgi:hypothetical protein